MASGKRELDPDSDSVGQQFLQDSPWPTFCPRHAANVFFGLGPEAGRGRGWKCSLCIYITYVFCIYSIDILYLYIIFRHVWKSQWESQLELEWVLHKSQLSLCWRFGSTTPECFYLELSCWNTLEVLLSWDVLGTALTIPSIELARKQHILLIHSTNWLKAAFVFFGSHYLAQYHHFHCLLHTFPHSVLAKLWGYATVIPISWSVLQWKRVVPGRCNSVLPLFLLFKGTHFEAKPKVPSSLNGGQQLGRSLHDWLVVCMCVSWKSIPLLWRLKPSEWVLVNFVCLKSSLRLLWQAALERSQDPGAKEAWRRLFRRGTGGWDQTWWR